MEFFGLSVLAIIGIIVAFILLTIAVNFNKEDDDDEGHGVFAFLIVAAFVFFMYWVEDLSFKAIINFLKDNTISIILYTLLYFTIGTVWSFYKWGVFLNKKIENLLYRSHKTHIVESDRPKPGANTALISMWVTYWPASLFWYAVSNPFIKVGKYIAKKFTGVYDRMSKSRWEKALQEKSKKQ